MTVHHFFFIIYLNKYIIRITSNDSFIKLRDTLIFLIPTLQNNEFLFGSTGIYGTKSAKVSYYLNKLVLHIIDRLTGRQVS